MAETALSDAVATEIFVAFRVVCERDAGDLWGIGLHGPLLVADPVTRAAFANCRNVSEPVWATVPVELPSSLPIANTAVDWDGASWTVVAWPVPPPGEERDALLAHEAWHRVQADMGFASSSEIAAHLDGFSGRVSLRRELVALADALDAVGSPAACRAAFARAIGIRTLRHSSLSDDEIAAENAIERNEGIAEYTGRRLGHAEPEQAVASTLRLIGVGHSLSRAFAYLTGPAYGLLLDRFLPAWRDSAANGASLTRLGRDAIGAVPQTASEAQDAADRKIVAEEREREIERLDQHRMYTQRFVDGPVLALPLTEMSMVFDPHRIVPLGDWGTVYNGAQVDDTWGTLHAEAGFLLGDGVVVVPAADIDTQIPEIRGEGWTLVLATGWQIEQNEPGNWRVSPKGDESPR